MQIFNIFRSTAFLGQIFEDCPKSNHEVETFAILPSIKNPRWIVPLKNKELFISSLALYQPSLVRAKFLKKMAILAAKAGLSNLTIRNRVYFQRSDDSIKKIFNRKALEYAIFTGTEGCHQKVTVQVMDEEGSILGYIKVSDNEDIDRLLKNEAEILGDLLKLEIKNGLFPKVIYQGHINDVNILILDTLKSVHSKFSSNLSDAHIDFLSEIFQKTSREMKYSESRFAIELRMRLQDLATVGSDNKTKEFKRLGEPKAETLKEYEIARVENERLEIRRLGDLYQKVVNYIEDEIGNKILPFGMCHRDFTPWNTFFHNRQLYVFDWEYAKREYPPMLDVFHFIVQDGILVRKLKPEGLIKKVIKIQGLIERYLASIEVTKHLIPSLFLCYLLDISLLYIEREKGMVEGKTLIMLKTWSNIIDLILKGYLKI